MIKTHLCLSLISISLVLPITNAAFAVDIEAGRVEATQCAICHGDNGEGNGIPNSSIAGLDEETFKKHLYAFKNGTRKNVMMERFAKRLSDEDIENLAAFYASQ